MNILLLPVGKRGYMIEYFQNALAGNGKVHAANSEVSPGLFAADGYFITPSMFSPDYSDAVLRYCADHRIDAVIPLTDLNLPSLSKAKQKFKENNISVVVADYDVVESCNDKWLTYQYMRDRGINTPQTYLSKDEFLAHVGEGNARFPVMVKPRFGMGTIGVYEAKDGDELDLFLRVSELAAKRSFLDRHIPAGILNVAVLQEKIPGTEYGLDVINDLQGNYKATFVKQKLGIVNGESNPVVFADIETIKDTGQRIGENLRQPGNCNVDVILAADGVYVLDINPRFGGCYPYSHLAGANIPRCIVSWLRGEEALAEDLTVTAGTYCYKDNVAKLGTLP